MADHSEEMKAVKLTSQQRWLLKRLAELGPNRFGGWNPNSFGGSGEALRARRLAERGYVTLNRLSPSHIRYQITDAGRSALKPKGES